MEPGHPFSLLSLAPTTGLEPVTSKLTASCSTIELRRNMVYQSGKIDLMYSRPRPVLRPFSLLRASRRVATDSS